ncbi:MAG: response regulator transcription factor [Actinomycetota bacterium]
MADHPIRVLLVEDHLLVRDALADALDDHPEISVAGVAASRAEGEALLNALVVDAVVADLQLGDGLGTDLVAVAKRRTPTPPVLLMTGTDDRKGLSEALAAGCAGFVSKGQGLDRLVEAVLVVAGGAAFFPASLLDTVMRTPAPRHDLTDRETDVLRLLATARTVTEISEELHLSPHTVRNHVKQILAKLGARSQLEAVVLAAREGLVDLS